MEILHALCHDNALGILPRPLSNAVTRVDASDASWFSRALGVPVGFGRTRSVGERLTVCIGAGEATKVLLARLILFRLGLLGLHHVDAHLVEHRQNVLNLT